MRGLGLGLGLESRRFPAILSSYDPDAAAFMARFVETPTTERMQLINTQFITGKTQAWWSKLDALYVHAAHGQEAGRLNWLGNKFNCLPVNNPVFTADRGFFPDGSASYLDTQFNPTVEAPLGSKFQQNSGALAVRSNTENSAAGSLAGFYDGAKGTTLNPRAVDNTVAMRVNSAAFASAVPTSPTAIGLFLISRTGASTVKSYRNGVTVQGTTTASAAVASGNLRLGSISNTSFRACQFSGGLIGAGFTDQDAIDYDNWMDTWLTAVGLI